MSDKENILLDPAEMDKMENIPEIKTVSEEDLPAESEVKEQFEEKPAPTASPDYTDAVPEASKPEHIGERSVCSIDALIQLNQQVFLLTMYQSLRTTLIPTLQSSALLIMITW